MSEFNPWSSGTRAAAIALALGMGVMAASPAAAQLDQAIDTAQQAADEGEASQERINDIDDERDNLVQEYRTVSRQLEDIREYNDRMRQLIADQESEMESLREQIDRVQNIERDILPLMAKMTDSLETFVELDAPFLLDERQRRIERIRRNMESANISVAEKFRVLLDAYKIENEYGRTIEASRGILRQGDTERTVDFLKVGRAAVYYQTLDGEETGFWHPQRKEWVVLPDGDADLIQTGLNVAREIVPPELLVVPVAGPVEAEEEGAAQ
jgi:septal ring factor EnvC (AmiA/AmiB activator)